MAVVQISKIQVRRGRKQGEAGVPQLSSGELAWAVDSQELYIGNGSVQEGSPGVGNSKVLTEHDNLLNLIESYKFARDDASINKSVFRTLQSKLDDRVNVKDFGAIGDGVADDTVAFQNAVDQLFRNTDTEFRKQLFIPTGHYLIANDLTIPSFALLEGESQVGAVIIVNDSSITVTSSQGTAPANWTSLDRPQNIIIDRLTFRFTTGHFNISGLKDSKFDRVSFEGNLPTIQDVASAPVTDAMVFMSNTNNTGTVINGLEFVDCKFSNSYRAFNFTQTDALSCGLTINDCEFHNLFYSIEINGVASQTCNWDINHNKFNEVIGSVLQADYGSGFKFAHNNITKCGNLTNDSDNPERTIIVFGEHGNNTVIENSVDRQVDAYSNVLTGDERVHYPEVLNASRVTSSNQIKQDLFVQFSASPLAMFSSLNRRTTLDYIVDFQNGSSRQGQITITLGDTLTTPTITDKYSTTNNGDANVTSLVFSVRLVDRSDSTAGSETMVLDYKNPDAGVNPDTISYFVSYGV
mgnify:CR=1 FL=1